MTCSECRELLAAYAEKLLDRPAEQAVELHLQDCIACRAEMNGVSELCEELLRDGRIMRETSMGASVLKRISRENARHEGRSSVVTRFLQTSAGRVSALAASVAIVVAVLFIILMGRSSGTAYALEQTIEANKSVRSIHVKLEGQAEMSDTWAQFDAEGKLEHLRMEFPKTEDGPKVVVWQSDKAEVWFKDKKMAVVVREPEMLKRVTKSFFDPKLAVEELYSEAAAGKAKIETAPPSKQGDPIKLIVTRSEAPDARDEYLVDLQTKLLLQRSHFKVEGQQSTLAWRWVYVDYNAPIDSSVFELELPGDVTVIDQTSQSIGLLKGNLSDEEIAAKVAREFFESLIAQDYAKASQLYEGIPPEQIKDRLGPTRFLRIISIGKPRPDPDLRTRFLQVPCEVEVEENGVKSVMKPVLNVRAVYNQPDRWTIGGGF